jgi:hypothetical protein
MSERDAIIQIIAEVMTHKAGDIYGVSVAEKLNLSRAEKAADAIIAARTHSPSSVEVIERCANVAEDFTTVAHIAYDIKTKVFPSRTSLNVVIANAIRALAATPAMPAPEKDAKHD